MNQNNQQAFNFNNQVQEQWIMISENLYIEKSRPLGQGGFGTVYKGKYGNQDVAVKELKQYIDNMGTVNEYYQQEIETSKQIMSIDCEYIVRVLGVVPTQYQCYVVMDLCISDLQKLRKESPNQRLDVMTALKCIKEICLGIKSLHMKNITHRDIKPDNIFIGKNQQDQLICKVGDFGLGKNEQNMISKVGTISYMAPDMLDFSNQKYTNKVDIWAIGVMAHELLTGTILFQGQTIDIIRNNILKSRNYKDWYKLSSSVAQTDFITQSFKHIQSESVINLIDMMLQKNPNDRKDINQIITEVEQCMSQQINNNAMVINNSNNNPYQNNQLNNQQYYAQNQPNNNINNSNNNQRQQNNQQELERKIKDLEIMMMGQKKLFDQVKNEKDELNKSLQLQLQQKDKEIKSLQEKLKEKSSKEQQLIISKQAQEHFYNFKNFLNFQNFQN
ncbi:protein kinase (macronuclear) [Tetrahymena thermophila SB210]|uniref:Protein kinase n=1 Tax=Tetrahymena thermophila (strain SB210) TaxID=312017 RepID=Q24E71_TETTS|nr:protein kinase [Tetrahymena thermophila SB210]EAS06030.2 protein kinase [Tetrahymena thermophila SB210]|eukprot:XP_001026275.2 protein kinase [Tetrahymena thermophila SB210]